MKMTPAAKHGHQHGTLGVRVERSVRHAVVRNMEAVACRPMVDGDIEHAAFRFGIREETKYDFPCSRVGRVAT